MDINTYLSLNQFHCHSRYENNTLTIHVQVSIIHNKNLTRNESKLA